jgi:hypothetical protein
LMGAARMTVENAASARTAKEVKEGMLVVITEIVEIVVREV